MPSLRLRRDRPGADIWSDIRQCRLCGWLFEVRWSAWTVWLCLIGDWALLAAPPVLGILAVLGGADPQVLFQFLIPAMAGALILPSAYRQRRPGRAAWLHSAGRLHGQPVG